MSYVVKIMPKAVQDLRDIYMLRCIRCILVQSVLVAAGVVLLSGVGEAAGPASDNPLQAAQLLGSLPVAGSTSQIVLVVGHELSFWEKG